MSLDFNTNTTPFGSVQGPTPIPPTGPTNESDTHDPTASTISQSLAEALMVQFFPAWPVLQQPNMNGDVNGSSSIDGISGAINAQFAKIGADMWERYLDNLEAQKQRINDYLKSPAYQLELDRNSTQSLAEQSQVNKFVPGRIESAMQFWKDTIDGVSNYVNSNKEVNSADAAFIVASFAITATYIGNYANVVDVASTNMVTVKPIQDAIGQIMPLVPQQIQEQFALTINLFAIGLINFANAEAIIRTGTDQQRAPTNWESVVSYAKHVLDKVEGNIISAYLMAMLVNHMEEMGSTQEQRDATFGKLVVLAKAMMLATAVAALLKAATPDVPLSAAIFAATMSGSLKATSPEDEKLVAQLLPLVSAFNKLKEESGMSESFWNNLTTNLASFFDKNPSTEDLVSPSTVYGKIVSHLFGRDIAV